MGVRKITLKKHCKSINMIQQFQYMKKSKLPFQSRCIILYVKFAYLCLYIRINPSSKKKKKNYSHFFYYYYIESLFSPKTVSGGIFGLTSHYVLFKINTLPYNWEVRRKMKDFIWLRNVLCKLFPAKIVMI